MMWQQWTLSSTNALPQFTDYHFKRLKSKPYGSQPSLTAQKMLLISAVAGADVGRQRAEGKVTFPLCLVCI